MYEHLHQPFLSKLALVLACVRVCVGVLYRKCCVRSNEGFGAISTVMSAHRDKQSRDPNPLPASHNPPPPPSPPDTLWGAMLRVLLPPLTHMLAQAYTQAQDVPTHTSDKNTPANTFNVVQLAGELLIARRLLVLASETHSCLLWAGPHRNTH